MSFVRQFLIYGIAGAASRLAAIVLVPLYTRALSIGEYGQLEVLLAVHALLIILGGLQMESAVARDYYDTRASGGDTRALAWCSVWLTVAGTALISAVMLSLWWLGWLPLEINGIRLALLLVLTLPAQLSGIQLVMLRFDGRSVRFALVSFSDLALCAAFSAWFILGLGAGIDGALWGLLAGKITCMLLAWPHTFGARPKAVAAGSLAQGMLRYGIPSIPAVLITWVQNAGSRLLLAMALTLSDVAIAGLAIKVAAIYGFVVYSFRLAWEPFSMARLASVSSDPGIYSRALEWYVAAMFLAAGVGALLCPYAVRILAPPEYGDAGAIAIFFLFGQFWVGITNLLVIGIHGARRTSLLLPVHALGAALNVTLLLALAPLIGVVSAGIAFLAGSVVSAALARHYSNLHFHTRFSLKIIVGAAIATVLFAFGWHQVALRFDATASITSGLTLFGAGIALVFVILFAVIRQTFEPGSMAEVRALLTSALHRGATPR